MPGLEELLGLGGQVDPAAAQPQGPSWTEMAAKAAADPVLRSGIISAGLQMMSGGWGNNAQRLAQSMGAGMEGAGGTAKSLEAQALNIRDFDAKQAEGAANRASHEKIAQSGQASREEVGRIRNEGTLAVTQERVAGMLERARMIRQPQSSQEMKIVSDAMNKYMTAQENQAILSKLTPEQRNEQARAYGLSVLETARGATGVRSQGSPLPTGAEDAPAVKPGAAAPATPAGRQLTWEEVTKTPGFEATMASPAGRAKLLKTYPYLEQSINEHAKGKGVPGYQPGFEYGNGR